MHHLFEKHLKADYVLGFERFWKCDPTKPCRLLRHPAKPCPVSSTLRVYFRRQ